MSIWDELRNGEEITEEQIRELFEAVVGQTNVAAPRTMPPIDIDRLPLADLRKWLRNDPQTQFDGKQLIDKATIEPQLLAPFPFVSLFNSAASAAVISGAATDVLWDSEREDAGSLHAAGTATVTIREAGVYVVTTEIVWTPLVTAGTAVLTEVLVNGTRRAVNRTFGAAVGNNVQCNIARSLRLNANDLVKVRVQQFSGVNQTLNSSGCALDLRWTGI